MSSAWSICIWRINWFSSIKSGARLVLVGDKDQIESVGPGKVFQEIIDSGVFPVTVLDECFRQEGNSTISQNAIKINKNQLDLVFDDTFQFIPASTPEEASRKIQKIYRKEVLQRNGSLEEVQVMSPLRKDTEAGTDALNLVCVTLRIQSVLVSGNHKWQEYLPGR